MITSHTELIQALIDKYNLESYCEIGLQNANNNFNKIKCKIKCSVDPDPEAKAMFDCTSDEFFKVNSNKFSIFFIDGLHHADQVKRDFENSLKCLNEGGFIVLHDCLPIKEETTHVPRDTRVWHGDCYKFGMTLCEYDGIDYRGCEKGGRCVWVWKDASKKGTPNDLPKDFETYLKHGKRLMNVLDEVVI